MELVDIGINLDHRSFDHDREQVIERARKAGVTKMVLTGATLQSSREVLELARTKPGIFYSTAGVHPHNARSCDQRTIPTLRQLASHPEVVAIGECGLDYNRDFSPRPVQDRWFEAQLELAAELQMPLFLHERDAHGRFIEILAKYRPRLKAAVVHCFTGTLEEAKAYLDLDLHIGITGWINDERRGLPLREVVKHIPLNRLMLETDAPFLIPRNIVPKPKESRNEPAYLPYVLRMVAYCMKKPVEEVARETTQTAYSFFNLATE